MRTLAYCGKVGVASSAQTSAEPCWCGLACWRKHIGVWSAIFPRIAGSMLRQLVWAGFAPLVPVLGMMGRDGSARRESLYAETSTRPAVPVPPKYLHGPDDRHGGIAGAVPRRAGAGAAGAAGAVRAGNWQRYLFRRPHSTAAAGLSCIRPARRRSTPHAGLRGGAAP